MTSTPELEAMLQRGLDREVLVVYADALQAAGDARGELIAIDLQLARAATPALLAARQAAAQRWLGGPSGALHWPVCTHELGLLDVQLFGDARSSIDDRLDAVLPLARYLRSVTIFGDARGVRQAMSRLATLRLPWLSRLSIDQVDRGPLPRSVVAAFAAAAPHLRALELRGELVIAAPLPASVDRLALRGRGAVVLAGDALPGVAELDLLFAVPDDTALRALAAQIHPRSYPDLTRLDLARNEPMYPRAHTSNVDALTFVALAAPERLRWLRLPSLRTPEQVAAVRGLLAAHPRLRIEIARTYREFAEVTAGLAHRRLRVPRPRPWPPDDTLSSRDVLAITAGASEARLSLVGCTEALEARFERMPAAAQAGWRAFWDVVTTLSDAPATLPAALLLPALAALPHDGRCADAAEIMRALPDGAEVQLARAWGW